MRMICRRPAARDSQSAFTFDVVDVMQQDATSALDYGQTRSIGVMTCDSEPSGVTCTDNSSGYYFRVSHESYQLGYGETRLDVYQHCGGIGMS
jgi:hypothetical protein